MQGLGALSERKKGGTEGKRSGEGGQSSEAQQEHRAESD